MKYLPSNNHQKYCNECRQKRSTKPILTCVICNIEIKRGKGARKYCPTCRKTVQNKRTRKYKQSKKGKANRKRYNLLGYVKEANRQRSKMKYHSVLGKAKRDEYEATGKGRENRKRYANSEKGKTTMKKWIESEHGKEIKKRTSKRYANSEKGKAKMHEYRQSEHGKEVKAKSSRKWRQSELGKEYMREYCKTEDYKIKQNKYQQTDIYKANHAISMRKYEQSDKGKAKNRRYHQSDKGQQSLRTNNYRRRNRITNAGTFDMRAWKQKAKFYKYTCLACDIQCDPQAITCDHKMPLIKGGTNHIDNLQPLCKSCNSAKHDKIIDYETNWQQIGNQYLTLSKWT